MTEHTREREEFEAWTKEHCSRHDLGYSLQKLANGEYMGVGDDCRWKQWQHQQQRIAALEAELKASQQREAELREWIPVSVSMPPQQQSVLIANSNNVGHARLVNGRWFVVASNDPVPIEQVTHWMPLPSPPRSYSRQIPTRAGGLI